MLVERSERVRNAIQDLARLQRIAQEVEGYRTRAKQLRDPLEAVQRYLILLDEFRHRGLVVVFDPVDARALRTQITQLAAAYHTDPASILTSGGKTKYTLWQALSDLPRKLETALQTTWREYVRSHLPVEHAQLLASLERIPSFSGQVASIRRLYRQAEILQSRLPRTPHDIDEVVRIEVQLSEAWRDLQGEGIAPGVVQFLQFATTGRATLRHVTPDVAEWVAKHDLQDTFRVGLQSSQP
jgi:hypothetical protein